MFTFFKKLAGIDADKAVELRNKKLAELDQQRAELDKLLEKMAQARKAATARVSASEKESASLRLSSNSFEGRLQLDSSPVVAK